MKLCKGNLWTDSQATIKLFTGNSTVRADGALVMGRGAALEAQKLFPGCNKVFGSLIRQWAVQQPDYLDYGVLLHQMPDLCLGVFQVKRFWAQDASLDLIAYSAMTLQTLATEVHPTSTIAVNFPGIGWGRLPRGEVLPVLQDLMPAGNIEVWEYR